MTDTDWDQVTQSQPRSAAQRSIWEFIKVWIFSQSQKTLRFLILLRNVHFSIIFAWIKVEIHFVIPKILKHHS